MKTLVAIPCLDMCHTDFVKSLVGLRYEGQVQVMFSQTSLVYDSRNILSSAAVSGEFDRILWLDSDMVFGQDLFTRLSARLDEGRQMVSGLYITRKPPVSPCIFKRVCMVPQEENDAQRPIAEPYRDYPEDSVFPIAGCGFGGVMMTTELVRKVQEEFGYPFSPELGFGEDLTFCRHVLALGEEIVCDSSIKMGHVGQVIYDEEYYKIQKEEARDAAD